MEKIDFDDPKFDLDWGYEREVKEGRREWCEEYPVCIKNCRACFFDTRYKLSTLLNLNKKD